MQTSERNEMILEYVKVHKHARIQELVELTGSSAATIRRDVNRLAEKGLVAREHGGIFYGKSLNRQPTTAEKNQLNQETKRRLAKVAAALVKPSMMVFLDAGTTSFELAKLLVNVSELTIITTDLRIACMLSESGAHRVVMTGGVVDNCSQSVVSLPYDEILSKIIPDICFCTCSAFDEKHGVTSPTLEKALLKRKLSGLGKMNVLVTDSSKFNHLGTNLIAALGDYDLLITDDLLPKISLKLIRSQVNIKLVTAHMDDKLPEYRQNCGVK